MHDDLPDQTDPDTDQAPSIRRLVLETLLFTAAVVCAVALLGYFFRAPLESVARWLIRALGYAGLFGGVFAADAFTLPIPPDFYLFVSIAGGSNVALTLIACSAASVLGGNLAYALGPYIGRMPLLQQRLADYRPRGEYLFEQWGGWAVGIAAMTPVPFSIVSWLAGIYRMRYPAYFVASLFRIPRIVGYYALYAYGWAPSAL
jgi:membrane protein YqaA with SNARE-associated domain